jgi:hypothetical protein
MAPGACAPLVRRLIEEHGRFVGGARPEALESGAQALVDRLSELFLVDTRNVVFCDRPRPHRRNRRGRIVYELHGECAHRGAIRIFVRTAARRQPVALLTLVHTLVHEWVHHYDFRAFGDSVHCAGFYGRLRQLYDPLRLQLRAGNRGHGHG